MELKEFGLIAVVALVIAILGQLTSRYARGGWVLSFGMALIGGTLGVWAAKAMSLPIVLPLSVDSVENFPVLYAMIGSVFAIAVAGFFTRLR